MICKRRQKTTFSFLSMSPDHYSRREFLSSAAKSGAAVGLLGALHCNPFQSNGDAVRRFHLSISIPPMKDFPDLIPLAKQAGVTDAWLGAFLYGRWFKTPQELRAALLWNIGRKKQIFQIVVNDVVMRTPTVAGLDVTFNKFPESFKK